MRRMLSTVGASCGKKSGCPKRPILDYLTAWRERFWLFHPERPFYQVLEAQIGTEYGAKKLNGEVSESENKYRLFQSYGGTRKRFPHLRSSRPDGFSISMVLTTPLPNQKERVSPLLGPAGWVRLDCS